VATWRTVWSVAAWTTVGAWHTAESVLAWFTVSAWRRASTWKTSFTLCTSVAWWAWWQVAHAIAIVALSAGNVLIWALFILDVSEKFVFKSMLAKHLVSGQKVSRVFSHEQLFVPFASEAFFDLLKCAWNMDNSVNEQAVVV